MNMPGFTAQASLDKANGHYRTDSWASTSVTKAIHALHPAAEVIEVHGCPPGTIPWIEGETAVCILTEPSWGGDGQSSGGDGGFSDAEAYGRGPGRKRPRKPERPKSEPKPKPRKLAPERCTQEHLKTEKHQQCAKRQEQDLLAGKGIHEIHFAACGEELSEVLCCIDPGTGPWICDVQEV